MLQTEIIQPRRRPVRRYDRSDLERIERQCMAYRVLGRSVFGTAPSDSLVVGGSLSAANFDFNPAKGITFGATPKATGTSPPVVTLGGTRARSAAQLLSGGIKFTVLTGGTTMDVSFDNGATTIASAVSIPAGSTYTPPSPNNDLTFTFPSSTYTAGTTYEVTVETWTDQIGGYTATNVTTAQQPRYFVSGLSSLPCLDFDGTDDRLTGTDSAVWSCFQNAPAFTLLQRLSTTTPASVRVAFSVANSGQASNGTRRFGTNSTGSGRANDTFQNDAAGTGICDGATNLGTTAHVFAWFSPGTTLGLEMDGSLDVTIDGTLACNPGTLTPNRYGFGCRVSSTAISFWIGKLGRHVGFNSQIADRAAWVAAL